MTYYTASIYIVKRGIKFHVTDIVEDTLEKVAEEVRKHEETAKRIENRGKDF